MFLILACAPLQAAALDARFAGFGTVGAGRVLTDKAYFAGYDNDWSYDQDTRIGAQLDLTSAQGVSFTTQIVGRGYDFSDASEHYRPEVQLMFGAVQLSDVTRVRAGRLRTPFFIYSDSADAGYAYPWVRAPSEVYTSLSAVISQMDGVDASYFQQVSRGTIEYRLAYGRHKTDLYSGDHSFSLELQPMTGFAVTADLDLGLFRYSVYRTAVTKHDPFQAGAEDFFRQLAPRYAAFGELADSLRQQDLYYNYHVIGVQLERYGWSLTSEAELAPSPQRQFALSFSGAYVSLVHPVGRWSPFVLLGYFENHMDARVYQALQAAQSTSLLPADQASASALGAMLVATERGLYGFDFFDVRRALGVRYDFAERCDVKVQFENTVWGHVKADAYPTSQNMISLALDWVL